jgi:hypothetical protein
MDENAGYVSLKLAEKLLPLPLTDEKVDVVSANIDRMQDRMGQRCSRRWRCCSKRPREPADHGSGFGGVTRSRMLLQLRRTFAARPLEGQAKGTSPDQIIVGHGAVVENNGKEVFRTGFVGS